MKKLAILLRRGLRLTYWATPKPADPREEAMQELQKAARKVREE